MVRYPRSDELAKLRATGQESPLGGTEGAGVVGVLDHDLVWVEQRGLRREVERVAGAVGVRLSPCPRSTAHVPSLGAGSDRLSARLWAGRALTQIEDYDCATQSVLGTGWRVPRDTPGAMENDVLVPLVTGLIGIVIGAVAGGITELSVESVRQGRSANAALRLIRNDVDHARALIKAALGASRWWAQTFELPVGNWLQYGELLATRLAEEDWELIAIAFGNLRDLNGHVAALRVIHAPAPPVYEPAKDDVLLKPERDVLEGTIARVDELLDDKAAVSPLRRRLRRGG